MYISSHAPLHTLPLPIYPKLQAQVKEPTVLKQVADTWQSSELVVHSLISAGDNNMSVKGRCVEPSIHYKACPSYLKRVWLDQSGLSNRNPLRWRVQESLLLRGHVRLYFTVSFDAFAIKHFKVTVLDLTYWDQHSWAYSCTVVVK